MQPHTLDRCTTMLFIVFQPRLNNDDHCQIITIIYASKLVLLTTLGPIDICYILYISTLGFAVLPGSDLCCRLTRACMVLTALHYYQATQIADKPLQTLKRLSRASKRSSKSSNKTRILYFLLPSPKSEGCATKCSFPHFQCSPGVSRASHHKFPMNFL